MSAGTPTDRITKDPRLGGEIKGLGLRSPQAGNARDLMTVRTVLREPEVWVLVGAIVAMFSKVLFGGETLFFRDLYMHFFPKKVYLAGLLRAGEMPFWDSLLQGGRPFFSDPINHVLYPSNLLYVVLDPVLAFNLEICAHVILTAVGAYFLGRSLGLRPVASLVAASVFTWNGITLSLVNHLNRLLAFAWLPWVLACWGFLRQGRGRRWLVAGVTLHVLQWLSGGAEVVALTAALLGCWALVVPTSGTSARSRVVKWFTFEALCVAVAAVQILPAAELISRSSRGIGISFAEFSRWSVNPGRLPEIVIPGFLGRTDTLAVEDFWGANLEEGTYPYLLSVYLGAVPVALAAGVLLGRRDALPRRVRSACTVVIALALLASLGRWLPGFGLIFRFVPLVSLFRYPVKFLMGLVPPLALLAGAAVDSHIDRHQGRSRPWRMAATLVCAGAALLGSGALLATSPWLATRFELFLFASSGAAVTRGLVTGCLHAGATAIASGTLLALLARLRRRWPAYLLAAVIATDLVIAGRTLSPTAPRAFLTDIPATADFLRNRGGRLFRANLPDRFVLRSASNNIATLYGWQRTVLRDYLAFSFGVPVVYDVDFDGLAPRPGLALRDRLLDLNWERRMPILAAGGVQWVMTHERLAVAGLDPVAAVPNESTVAFYLYRNAGGLGPAAVVPSVRLAGSEREALKVMGEPGFDPHLEAVLVGSAEPIRPCDASPGSVSVLRRTTNRLWSRVNSVCGGYVVFTDSFDPGWRTTVDGVPAGQLRANVAFAAVRVGPGSHTVERNYRPAWLGLGAAISSVSVLAFLGIIVLGRGRIPGGAADGAERG